jgi:hypothetical protein
VEKTTQKAKRTPIIQKPKTQKELFQEVFGIPAESMILNYTYY